MALTEDLSVFFNTAEFGTAAVFAHGTSTTTASVLFDHPYTDLLGIEGGHPRAHGMASELPSVGHGDTLALGTATYAIRSVHPDGMGVVTLILQEQ